MFKTALNYAFIFGVFVCCFLLPTKLFAQQIDLKRNNASLESIILDLEKQTNYAFFYKQDEVAPYKNLNVDLQNTSLKVVLENLLKDIGFDYNFYGKTIVISKRANSRREPVKPQEAPRQQRTQSVLIGQIFNEQNMPISGASIKLERNQRRQIMSDKEGKFLIRDFHLGESIVVSYVGYVAQTIEIKDDSKPLFVFLVPALNEVEEVVVTGLFERKKETFTGATNTISGDKLRTAGNNNIIQSLKSLDPSFVILDNNLQGSNPNALANIELRGKSSIPNNNLRTEFGSTANQPLFILNGFPSTLQQISDLDINRIASVTLLKDAASTAIYGGKASNGVVVVETIRPKPGELRLGYNNDTRFDFVDLSSYNMMNAAELLEFQRLSNYYSPWKINDIKTEASIIASDLLYQRRLKNVLNGVDSYWLDAPLRDVAPSVNNNLSINGGSDNFMFDINLNYRDVKGSLKGSQRKTWGASNDITYRRNNLNFSNRVFISGYKANNSPYGSFSEYVRTAPYFKRFNDDGSLNENKYLEEFQSYYVTPNGGTAFTHTPIRVANPLYNATLNSLNETNEINIADNFNMIWDASRDFRVTVGGQLFKEIITNVDFLSPMHTNFDNVDPSLRGTYANLRTDKLGYNGYAALLYNKTFADKHVLVANLRSDFTGDHQEFIGLEAIGFPSNANPNPFYAREYATDSKPNYGKQIVRSMSFLASANYAYQNKYLIDASYRLDGSSIFGNDNKYNSFWSVGAGWNLHRESFLSDVPQLSLLRLRASYGYTGNQDIGNYTTNSVFTYSQYLNGFGNGYLLSKLGIPGLTWQSTSQFSTGLEAGLWNDRLNLVIDFYNKVTDPLIIPGSLPSSSGVPLTYLNYGGLINKGIEWRINYSPIYRRQDNVIWTVGIMGAVGSQKYRNIEEKLGIYNEDPAIRSDYYNGRIISENQMLRFKDGASPNDIWAVRSLGIDPSSGRELFLKKDGTPTYTYTNDDIVAIGNTQPKLTGVFNTNLNYKGFLFNAYIRFSFAGDILNTALYQRVENISFEDLVYNQDKRALTSRWINPGDVAQFKGISYTDYTQISSRFVQRQNYISGESISIGYEFRKDKHAFLNKFRANMLRINLMTTDIFRISNIQNERGLDYPFSRYVSGSLNLFF